MYSNRVSPARQDASSTDCRHVREPFDQGFHIVSHRADLSSDARLLHAFLVSLHRTGRMLTQAEMADEIGLTRHRVWAGLRELVAADLLKAVRVGLGQPNRYVLVGLDAIDLDGSARPETASRPVRRRFPASPESSRAGTFYPEEAKKNDRINRENDGGNAGKSWNGGYIRPNTHAGYRQPARRSSDLLVSRHGPVVPRR